MNNFNESWNKLYVFVSNGLEDILAFNKQIFLPNRQLRQMRKGCLISGLACMVSIAAMHAFLGMPVSTLQSLFPLCAIPLVGAATGIPIFVYLGTTLTPILIFMVTAIAFSSVGINPKL
ncbi:MAG: hypothetical protein H0V82_00345 [Candidatus Protochlamydia sp.]|nr:hypothetical protein [Candidatus Protochlamydia sp.]